MPASPFTDLPESVTVTNHGEAAVNLNFVGVIAPGQSVVVPLKSRLESKRLAVWKALKSAAAADVVKLDAPETVGKLTVNNPSDADVNVDGLVLAPGTNVVSLDEGSASDRSRKYKALSALVAAGVLTVGDEAASDATEDNSAPADDTAPVADEVKPEADAAPAETDAKPEGDVV